MSWIQKLYETYNNSQSMIGAGLDDDEVPLLPICHTTQKAQIEIVLDGNGKFKNAKVLRKDESRTIIPCTESSAGRTSGPSAHPLCDKLQYIAADYKKHGGDKKHYHDGYVKLLSGWVEKDKNKKVQLVYEYIKQGTVISDLVESGVLVADKNKKLLKQRLDEKDKKAGLDIFDLLPGGIDPKTQKIKTWQADAFVRWQVEIPNDPQSAVWSDQEILQSWINYYSSTKETKALCYVTGEESFSADQHPAKLRNDGDKAKIISSNDNSGFTFRGRFINANQAATVGFETTQKAHSALRWLISRQGYQKGDLAIVAWATSGAAVPKPFENPLSSIDVEDLPSDAPLTVSTAQEVAIKFKKKIAGYGKEIGDTTDIVVMGVDSATTGRLAIIYYRELKGSDFLKRINAWHETCAWIHYYGSIDVQDEKSNKPKKRYIPFIGAPAPNDIADAVLGNRPDDKFKLRRATIARLVPCIIDGQPIPRDLVESVVRLATNRLGIRDPKDKFEREWNKALSIACAVYKKFKEKKENYSMALDETRNTRDYLYGRLLALADHIEESALRKANEKRATNAARYMQQFSQRPFRTWNQIHSALTPYVVRLGGAGYYKSLIAEVTELFISPEDYMNDKPLSGEYLLGYYCQRQKLWEKAKKDEPSQKVEDDNENTEE
jgi:CRISPR-associated protein Csd1